MKMGTQGPEGGEIMGCGESAESLLPPHLRIPGTVKKICKDFETIRSLSLREEYEVR